MKERKPELEDEISLPKMEKETEEIPVFLKGIDSADSPEENASDTEEMPVLKKKTYRNPGKAEKKDIRKQVLSVVLFVLMTAVLLVAGINIAGYFMNSRSSDTAAVTPAATETPEHTSLPATTSTPDPVINTGTLTVLADAITTRAEPSLDGEQVGSVYAGETYTYTDVQEADGYTWYEISAGIWIASDGTWLDISE